VLLVGVRLNFRGVDVFIPYEGEDVKSCWKLTEDAPSREKISRHLRSGRSILLASFSQGSFMIEFFCKSGRRAFLARERIWVGWPSSTYSRAMNFEETFYMTIAVIFTLLSCPNSAHISILHHEGVRSKT